MAPCSSRTIESSKEKDQSPILPATSTLDKTEYLFPGGPPSTSVDGGYVVRSAHRIMQFGLLERHDFTADVLNCFWTSPRQQVERIALHPQLPALMDHPNQLGLRPKRQLEFNFPPMSFAAQQEADLIQTLRGLVAPAIPTPPLEQLLILGTCRNVRNDDGIHEILRAYCVKPFDTSKG